MTIFWIFFACFLQSAVCLQCDRNESKKVTLIVKVEHHQQAYKGQSILTKKITSSKRYSENFESLQDSFDVSASISASGSASAFGGLGKASFSAAASGAYSEFNSEVRSSASSSSDYKYEEKRASTEYHDGELQIWRTVTTNIIIDGISSAVTKKDFVDSAPTTDRWTTEKRHDASVRYLKNKFYGEDSKIRGTTYTAETCQPLKCGLKCKNKKEDQLGWCTYKCNQNDEASHKCETWWIDYDTGESKIVGKCDDDSGCVGDYKNCTSTCIDNLGEKPDGTCGRFQDFISVDIFRG